MIIRYKIHILLLISIFKLISSATVAKSGGDYTTIQAALDAANSGDTVFVKSGTYKETISFPKSGIVLCNFETDTPVIDGNGTTGNIVTISNKNNVVITGFNIKNASGGDPSVGISIDGACYGVVVANCKVYNIKSDNKNAHGIAAYGTESTPIRKLSIYNNKVFNCLLGESESLVLNGNVDSFEVYNNEVYDNDNIGIDFIGFENTAPTEELDQARNGVCFGNHVYNISSKNNPAYQGERSADGIYVDGGRDIIIERNIVDNCDIGVEVASEHGGKTTSNITARNNFISNSFQGNIMCGGYASNRGNAVAITFVNNTTYRGNDGEIILQFNNDNVVIKNNILYTKSGGEYVISSGNNNKNITVNNNMYYGSGSNSSGDWNDANAIFSNPKFLSLSNLHIDSTSLAINSGSDIGNLGGTFDIDEESRVYGTSIDIGADEYTPLTSAILQHKIKNQNIATLIQSNIFEKNLILSLNLNTSANVGYTIFNIKGEILHKEQLSILNSGHHHIKIDTKNFATQVLFIELNLNDLNIPIKLVKMN